MKEKHNTQCYTVLSSQKSKFKKPQLNRKKKKNTMGIFLMQIVGYVFSTPSCCFCFGKDKITPDKEDLNPNRGLVTHCT